MKKKLIIIIITFLLVSILNSEINNKSDNRKKNDTYVITEQNVNNEIPNSIKQKKWGIIEWVTIISAVIGLISMGISIVQAICAKRHAKNAEDIKNDIIQFYKERKQLKKDVSQKVNLEHLLNKLKNLDIDRKDIEVNDSRRIDFYGTLRTINETQIDKEVKDIINGLFLYESKKIPNKIIHQNYESVNNLVKELDSKTEGV